MSNDGYSLPLYARYDASAQGSVKEWRCYSADSLTTDLQSYSTGTAYCSRNSQLLNVLSLCQEGVNPVLVFPYHYSGIYCFRIPLLLKLPTQGVLLAFAEARIYSCSDGGPKHLAMRRSFDNGQTWTALQYLVSDYAGNPSIDGLNLGAVTLDEQTGVVFVHYVNGSHSLNPAPSYVLSSKDGGSSWSAPVDITAPLVAKGVNMFAGGPGSGIQLASGRLVVPGWYNWCCGQKTNNTDTGSVVLISDDHGNSWSVGGKIPWGTGSLEPNECQVAQMSNGSLLLNARDSAGGSSQCHCR